MKKYLLTLNLAAIFLIGCTNGDVQMVKEMTVPGHPQYTVEQALDNKNICSNIKWEKFTDEKGRKIVQQTCELRFVNNYMEKIRDDNIKIAVVQSEKKLKSFEEEKKNSLDNLTELEASLKNYQEQLKNLPAEIGSKNDANYIKYAQENKERLIVENKLDKLQFAAAAIRNNKYYFEDTEKMVKEIKDEEENWKNKSIKKFEKFKDAKVVTQWVINNEKPIIINSRTIVNTTFKELDFVLSYGIFNVVLRDDEAVKLYFSDYINTSYGYALGQLRE